jgi:hypothetical protein
MEIDANTPDFGTPISEWMRLVDINADGQTVHEVHNVLARLVANRYEAGLRGWNPIRLLNDIHCERRLRLIIRGKRRIENESCEVAPATSQIG